VGARGLGGFKGLLLGSVSKHCLHHATTPVAVVRELPDDRPLAGDRVVVAVDGSGTSQGALHWALEEGRARKATVEVVNAWQMSYVGFAPLTVSEALEPGAFEAASRQVLDAALAREDLRGLDG
jgi:nucleotide-binding universal stress UspA family protein